MQKNYNFTIVVILISLIVIFLDKISLFKNFYNSYTKTYDSRFLETYGFCNKQSAGYLNYVSKKFKLREKRPLIINYKIGPSNFWAYNFQKLPIDNNYIIVLNYSAILKRNTIKINDNQFQIPDIDNTLGVEKIKINFLENINNNYIINFLILSDDYRNKKVLFSKDYNITLNNNSFTDLNLDFNTLLLNNRDKKIYLMLKELNNKDLKINNIEIFYKNLINLKDFKIIDRIDSCYLLKKKNGIF
jgi:hypothetical protein